MNELQSILKAAESNDGAMYLATVVDVDGSAYRRPGARMLILPEGRNVGMISGGCLERELCRHAASLCKRGPKLISFDTRSESANFKPRYNLGCNGLIYILLEPITHDDRCPLRLLRDVFESRTPRVVATVYQSDRPTGLAIGERLTIDSLAQRIGIGPLATTLEQVGNSGTAQCIQIVDSSHDQTSDDCVRIFLERLSPPKPFWLFGAGDDAIPMARIANGLGWSVSVIDDKASNLTKHRFPNCDLKLVGSVNQAADQLLPSSETAAVLMTHSFDKDAMLLPWLCKLRLSYIGLLGPKSRAGKLFRLMHQKSTLPCVEELENLHTPVGLDIGACDPAQIAIAIAAEIVAVDNRRDGSSLALRTQPIHEPVSHRLIEIDYSRATEKAYSSDE